MPKFEVEIHESGARTYVVEAPSIHHVKKIILEDENGLGDVVDSTIFSSEARITDETGRTVEESNVDDLLHLGDENGDPVCGNEAGTEWETTGEREYVNCPLCLEKVVDGQGTPQK